MEHISLDDARLPDYEPVSYTWLYEEAKTYILDTFSNDGSDYGSEADYPTSPSPTKTSNGERKSGSEASHRDSQLPTITSMKLDQSSLTSSGQSLAISEGLAKTLPYLVATSMTGYLWIDQLCINQDDEVERTEQVSIMHEIYGRGFKTLIWLGEDSKDTEFIQSVIKVIGSNPKQYQRLSDDFDLEVDNIEDLPKSVAKELCNGNLRHFNWSLETSLSGIWSRRWVSVLI